MPNILVLNGPNLNLLGAREPLLYGTKTLDQINADLSTQAVALNHQLHCLQSNAEGTLIDAVQKAHPSIAFIIINPGALTHTSIALRDAFLSVDIPFIEVHLSNIYRRESFRHQSYLSDIAIGTIIGLGSQGYHLALQYADHHLSLNRQ